jgi:hypothetical protein
LLSGYGKIRFMEIHPAEPVYISGRETQKIYLLVEHGVLPELEDEYIRARLEEGFEAARRGEEEEWNADSIKADGRRILEQRGQES